MFANKGLAFRLIVLIVASTGLIFIAAFAYNYFFVRYLLLQKVEESAENLSRSIANRIEESLWGVQKISLNMAALVGDNNYTKDQMVQLVGDVLANNDEIYGSAIAFEPFVVDSISEYFGAYAYRDTKHDIAYKTLGGDSYRYSQFDWYKKPKETMSPVWTEPYYDEGGGDIIMTTFSAPIFKEVAGAKKLFGVAAADLSLSLLREKVGTAKIFNSGYAFLLSAKGVFVSHPSSEFVMRESIFDIADKLNDAGLRDVGREMTGGKQGFVRLTDFYTGSCGWLFYTPLKLNGWSVGIMIPESELLLDVRLLTMRLSGIVIVGLLGLSLMVAVICGRIIRPLKVLTDKTAEISKGNLDIELPESVVNDEIGNLTRSFKGMTSSLKEYIQNLAKTTAAKERIESELKLASAIQRSFLPKEYPPFPGRTEFDIFATLEPAKEVGGDLYDFFLLGEDTVFVSIGDVSGKGVPAALFMAVTKTLVKGIAEPGMLPGDILVKVNNELCQENDSGMFVTFFCGVLNYKTGEMVYANAGHNPPILLRAGKQPEWLGLPAGMVLGLFEDSKYECRSVKLAPGDTLLGYTDGVTEALNGERKMYSSLRLLEYLKNKGGNNPESLVGEVFRSVKDYVAGAPQSDDITIMALRLIR